MNIPLEPHKPLEGVASPAPGVEPPPAPAPRRYTPRPLEPRRMWAIIRTLVMLRKDVGPLKIAQSIVPRSIHVKISARGKPYWKGSRKLVGFPGAGVFHGSTNISKSITYRAVRNLDFNTERNARRFKLKQAILQELINARS